MKFNIFSIIVISYSSLQFGIYFALQTYIPFKSVDAVMFTYHFCLFYYLITQTHFHSPSFIIYFLSKYVNACIFSLASSNRKNYKRQIGQIIFLCIARNTALSFSKQRRINLISISLNTQIIILMDIHNIPGIQLPSGNKIPVIGYGTYQLKGKQCLQGVRWALEAGYTHIDTASIYKNQEQIGQVLKDMKIERGNIFITSKIAPAEQGYEQAMKACEEIIHRLQCNYLDLLIIHWPGVSKQDVKSQKNRDVRRQTWRALVQLRKLGKVRDIGVSNYLKRHLQDLMAHSQVKPAINQFQIHPLLWQKETIEYCRVHGIAIEAYSPLARNDDKLFKNQTVLALADKYNKTIAQICLRWSIQHGFIVLPKSKTKERIYQNIDIFNFQINAQDMKQLDQLRKSHVHTCWDPSAVLY